jgi:hypothetical protein
VREESNAEIKLVKTQWISMQRTSLHEGHMPYGAAPSTIRSCEAHGAATQSVWKAFPHSHCHTGSYGSSGRLHTTQYCGVLSFPTALALALALGDLTAGAPSTLCKTAALAESGVATVSISVVLAGTGGSDSSTLVGPCGSKSVLSLAMSAS